MIPHEKALVERLRNEPFALIGINTDGDLAAFKDACKKQGVTWRNSFQGSTSGPLCRSWGVRGYPTIYVLDHKGVIRNINVREKDMDRAVDALLAELKAEQKNAPGGEQAR
jgi:hypothetical protein